MTDLPPTTPPAEPDPEDAGRTIRPFALWLREQPGGLHDELSEKLADLAAAVMEHGEGGSLTLKVEIRPMPRSDRSVVQTFTKVALKAPEAERAIGMFFADDGGNLHRNDPRQMEFPIVRAVTDAEGNLRRVDTETGEVREAN